MSEFFLDRETREALEWDQFLSLLEVCSPLGFLKKQKVKPFFPGEEGQLRTELQLTHKLKEFLIKHPSWGRELKSYLKEAKDLRVSFRDAASGRLLSVTDLFEIKRFLWVIKQIRELLNLPELSFLASLKPRNVAALWQGFLLGGQSAQSFFLVDAYSKELRRWRRRKVSIERKLEDERARIEASFVFGGLKLGRDLTINIPRHDKDKIEEFSHHPHFLLLRETAQNLCFSLRKSKRILLWEEELKQAEANVESAEKEVRRWLSRKVGEHVKRLLQETEKIATLDFLQAKTNLAFLFPMAKPRIIRLNGQKTLSMKDGIHTPLALRLAEHSLKFHPLTIELKRGSALVTGANMSGKTVLLKTLGLNVALAQHGFLVPATSFSLSLRDYVFFSKRGKEPDGLSAFGAEIMGLRRVWEHKDGRGLLLIDELARGTNPQEGFAINAALLEHFKQKDSLCLMTSHFDRLAQVTGVEHWQMAGLSKITLARIKKLVEEGREGLMEGLMSYKLSRVSPSMSIPHDALKISLLLGLNQDVIELAERFLEKFLP